MKVLTDISVSGKRVFLRGDLDISITNYSSTLLRASKFQITNIDQASIRLKNLRPTVDYLIEHSAKQIVIAGHIGRPTHEASDGKPADREKLSTKNLIEPLEKFLGKEIEFRENVILGTNEVRTPESNNEDSGQARMTGNEIATSRSDNLNVTRNDESEGKIVLLENLRFWEGEEKNDPEFAKELASLADVYVNDAFGVCHRNHASIVEVPAMLPHAAGLHLEQEIVHLTELIKDPKRPFAAIVGGAKIETKVPVIENLAKIANTVLVGGELALQGETLRGYGERVSIASLTADGKDIDEESIRQFTEIIKKAKTIVWNGPMGVYEQGYDRGTMAIADAIIKSGCYSVVGGGETTEFLSNEGLLKRFSFVSSGGGAMLEYLSGKELPGIKALE